MSYCLEFFAGLAECAMLKIETDIYIFYGIFRIPAYLETIRNGSIPNATIDWFDKASYLLEKNIPEENGTSSVVFFGSQAHKTIRGFCKQILYNTVPHLGYFYQQLFLLIWLSFFEARRQISVLKLLSLSLTVTYLYTKSACWQFFTESSDLTAYWLPAFQRIFHCFLITNFIIIFFVYSIFVDLSWLEVLSDIFRLRKVLSL